MANARFPDYRVPNFNLLFSGFFDFINFICIFNKTLALFYIAFTKLAFKLKKVFDKIMKREFPPEVDYSDDLYEEKDQVKLPKAKKPKIENEKTPKEKKPKKEKKTSLQKLQSYKTMITPEFAHAQILQAKLQQGQLQSGDISSAPQTILPKLGIPQDILAKMSPAQLQMFMLQYRAGAFPGFNKKRKNHCLRLSLNFKLFKSSDLFTDRQNGTENNDLNLKQINQLKFSFI